MSPENFQFISMRATLSPESLTSNRYRVSVGYHGDPLPDQWMSVPDRKRGEKYILDCVREEALTFSDDEPENAAREALYHATRRLNSLAALARLVSSSTYSEALSHARNWRRS